MLDDGVEHRTTSTTDKNTPLPWLTTDQPGPRRVAGHASPAGDPRLPQQPWKLPADQPGDAATATTSATFTDTRHGQPTPQTVGGDLKLATFNVLNYFPTTGEDCVAGGGHTCTFFNDRAGNPVGDNDCSANGPRGAAESSGGTDLADPKADLERQQAKIVTAINTLDADIVSLEEIENSAQFGETDRDDALEVAGRRAERRRRHDPLGATSRRRTPADLPAARRAGRHPHGVHLQAGERRSSVGASQVLVDSPDRQPSPTPASRWPRRSSRRAPPTPTPSW